MIKELTSIEKLRVLLDDPKVSQDLRRLQEEGRQFTERRTELIEAYPDEYVVFHNGRVRAHGKTLKEAMREADAKGVPRVGPIVEFMAVKPRPMTLPYLFQSQC